MKMLWLTVLDIYCHKLDFGTVTLLSAFQLQEGILYLIMTASIGFRYTAHYILKVYLELFMKVVKQKA